MRNHLLDELNGEENSRQRESMFETLKYFTLSGIRSTMEGGKDRQIRQIDKGQIIESL